MTDRYKLNENRSPIDPSSWSELNQNWEFIKSYFRFIQRQINLISGAEVDEIIDRLDIAITNAENATGDAIAAKQAVDQALQELSALVARATTAAERAETAADEGNRINTVLSALQLELEALQANLNTIVQSEAQRILNEDTRIEAEQARTATEQNRVTAENEREMNELERKSNELERISSSAAATTAANAAAERANTSAGQADSATNAAIQATTDANTATAGAIQATTEADAATQASIAQTQAANNATQNANFAAQFANEHGEEAKFQAFQAENAKQEAQNATMEANTATDNANTATSRANTAASLAETATTNANTATASANAAATEANVARDSANLAASLADGIATELRGYDNPISTFSLETSYLKHQFVRSGGNTYKVKVDTQGNPLPAAPALSNEWFDLVSEKGEKGEMGTGISILGKVESTADLPVSGSPGDAYLIGPNIHIWDGNGWTDGGVIQGPQGEQGIQGETGVGLQYTWSGTQLGVKRADEVSFTYSELKGAKGDKGDPGTNGTDANVTNENVINALGYTPANSTNLAEVDERLTTQLADIALWRNVKQHGVKGVADGVMDSTVDLNSLPAGYTYVIPADTYMIKAHTDDLIGHGGFRPKANTKYIFLPGAKLKAITSPSSTYSVVWIDTTNVEIHNIVVEGERSTHVGSTGEFGYGINIRNNAKVKLFNPIAYDCWGDGFIINTFQNSYVEIHNANSYNNRRQGISIMCCDVVRVYNSTFRDSNGTAPQLGLDIEPNYVTDILNDILFRECTFSGNATAGIGLYGGYAFPAKYKINFIDCEISGNKGVAVIVQSLPKSALGSINFFNTKCKTDGFHLKDSEAEVFIDKLLVEDAKRAFRFETTLNNSVAGNLTARNVTVKDTAAATLQMIQLWNIGGLTGNKIRDIDIEINSHNIDVSKVIINNGGVFEGKRRIKTNSVKDTTTNLFTASMPPFAHQKITNKGASTAVTCELNSNAVKTYGTEYEFEIEAAQYLQINTVDSTIIPLGLVRVRSNVIGARIKLKYDGTSWRIIEQVGTWETY